MPSLVFASSSFRWAMSWKRGGFEGRAAKGGQKRTSAVSLLPRCVDDRPALLAGSVNKASRCDRLTSVRDLSSSPSWRKADCDSSG